MPHKIHRFRVRKRGDKSGDGYVTSATEWGDIALPDGEGIVVCLRHLHKLWEFPLGNDFDICVSAAKGSEEAVEIEVYGQAFSFKEWNDGRYEQIATYALGSARDWLEKRGFPDGAKFWVWVEY